MENPIKLDDFGGTPIFGNICLFTREYLPNLVSLSVSILGMSTVQPSGGPDGRRTCDVLASIFESQHEKLGICC